MPVACGVAAALPDIDFLLPLVHRGPTHSIAAAIAAGVGVFSVVSLLSGKVTGRRTAAVVGLAVLSHALLDWLGQDSSTPRGVMALWPISSAYYISDLNLFNAVDRRYWLDGFWWRNTVAVAREVLILAPLVWISRYRNRVRTSARGDPPRPSASAGGKDDTSGLPDLRAGR